MLFAERRNVKQVQRWLGHAKASITLDTYLHCSTTGCASRSISASGVAQPVAR